MPITTDERNALVRIFEGFDTLTSVKMACLLYETLRDASISKQNPTGLTTEAVTSLGRALYDKHSWAQLSDIEAAIGKGQQLRLPIIKSADTIFRPGLLLLPGMTEEDRQLLAGVLAKMDESEMVAMGQLIYETLCHANFSVQTYTGIHPFSKFLYARWEWSDLKERTETVKGICLPIITAVHEHLRIALPKIFTDAPISEEKEPPMPPEIQSAVEVAEAVEAVEQAAAPSLEKSEAAAAQPAEVEGDATDAEPFAAIPEDLDARGAGASPAKSKADNDDEEDEEEGSDAALVMDADQNEGSSAAHLNGHAGESVATEELTS